MTINQGMFSSATDNWATPQWLFDKLDAVFKFELDAAADWSNAQCKAFYTKEDDGLSREWTGTVWCNPPYSRGLGAWLKKGLESAQAGATVVMLIPARTDTAWFHDYAVKGEITFLKGRLKFGGSKNSAPFPSMIVVFRPRVGGVLEGFSCSQ